MPLSEYEGVSSPSPKRKKKKKKGFGVGDIIRIAVIICAVAVFIVALTQILHIQKGYKEAEDIYKDIDARIVDDETLPVNVTANRTVSPTVSVNWDALYAEQPNAVGYIEVPACAIKYPIVRGDDNDYYLTHAFNDAFSYSGAIFLDYRESLEMTEDHIVLYGHHMNDGSMFAELLEYDDEAFFNKNDGRNYFFLYTPENIRVFQIFAVTDVSLSENTKAFTINITDTYTLTDYASYLNTLQLYDTGVTYNGGQICTLFTCQTDSSSNTRHMVHGQLVETIEYTTNESETAK